MFEITKRGAVHVISGESPLNAESGAQLEELFSTCLESGQPRLVFDMQSVPLLNSEGLELLLDLRDRCLKRSGGLQLANPNPLCREILGATGVAAQIAIFDDLSAAVGSYSR
jgi:anti-sigma B factor antagonist